MKKVINGSLYNTDTARFLASWDNKLQITDFAYCAEDLYRTKAGKYFLHCHGGPNSRYGVWHGNSGGWGEEIVPLSPIQAQEWAEQHLSGEEYTRIFGDVEEAADDREVLNISVPVCN